MKTSTKIGILFILVGICLPTATMPFITQFKPVPELCLTSNFFQNLGNMVVVFGQGPVSISADNAGSISSALSIPYRYLFSFGIILTCIGAGTIVINTPPPTRRS
jgi:hypothetical protein